MLVNEIMTKNVVSIDVDDTVLNACLKYRDKKIFCYSTHEQTLNIISFFNKLTHNIQRSHANY